MASGLRRGIVPAIIVAIACAAAGAAPAPVGEPMAVESTALVPLDSESSVSIMGIRGEITVVTREERELRVISRAAAAAPGTEGAELPVGIWTRGSRLIVAPPPADAGLPRRLHVEVPREFGIRVDAADSRVGIVESAGQVELRGTDLRISVTASSGSLDADVQGGTIELDNGNEATLKLKGVALKVDGMKRSVDVFATGGTIALAKIGGQTDVECEDSTLIVNGAGGPVHVKARKGQATLTGIKAGAELEMSGTPLKLTEGKGDITVTSDAPVEFQSMIASLHFDMYGGSLHGKGNQGIVEVRTRNTEVSVEGVDQGMRIQGDGLKAKIVDVQGELYIETSISDVVVDQSGTVVVKLDRGSLNVQRAAGAVQAEVLGADVHITDSSGAVTLDLDGGDAEVSWAWMPADKDSRLTNKNGNITATFPPSSACRVEARSTYGRVESDLPAVKVADDRSEAHGSINGGSGPMVKITANGDIHLVNRAVIRDAN